MKQKESMKEAVSMEQVDWSSLNKILSDTTRRNILELLKEKDAISYTNNVDFASNKHRQT
jgi:DNA-binding transcriptional ArsR family regulator